MEQPRREADLYETCSTLINESRRVRIDLDKALGSYVTARLGTYGFCFSLLDEATARVAARERIRAEQAHRVIDDMF